MVPESARAEEAGRAGSGARRGRDAGEPVVVSGARNGVSARESGVASASSSTSASLYAAICVAHSCCVLCTAANVPICCVSELAGEQLCTIGDSSGHSSCERC